MQSGEDMIDFCEIGDCSLINITTCERNFQDLVNESSPDEADEIYDENGCFYTERLRGTEEYDNYLKVNFKEDCMLCKPDLFKIILSFQ